MGTQKSSFGANFFFLRKNAFFDPHLVQNAHKMAQNGVKWGGLGGQFWVFEDPRPFGTSKNVFLKKKFFFEKKIFLPILAQKDLEKFRAWAPVGNFVGFCLVLSAEYLGLDRELCPQTWLIVKPKYSSSKMVPRVFDEFAPSLRFLTSKVLLTVPGHFLSQLAVTGQTEGFWGPFCALMWPFLAQPGLSVGANGYILSYLAHQNHSEPY